jgi:hypothetical protein
VVEELAVVVNQQLDILLVVVLVSLSYVIPRL